jgi:hypothetical protein
VRVSLLRSATNSARDALVRSSTTARGPDLLLLRYIVQRTLSAGAPFLSSVMRRWKFETGVRKYTRVPPLLSNAHRALKRSAASSMSAKTRYLQISGVLIGATLPLEPNALTSCAQRFSFRGGSIPKDADKKARSVSRGPGEFISAQAEATLAWLQPKGRSHPRIRS